MPRVVVLFGIAGSGKSTLAGMLERRFDVCHIDSDHIARPLVERGMDADEAYATCLPIFREIVAGNAAAPYDYVYTDSCSRASDWPNIEKLSAVFAVTPIRIVCDVGVALDRIQRRARADVIENDRGELLGQSSFHESVSIAHGTFANDGEASLEIIAGEIARIAQLRPRKQR